MLFWLISKAFGLVRLLLLPWGSHEDNFDEDLFLHAVAFHNQARHCLKGLVRSSRPLGPLKALRGLIRAL